ncbi:hypothetical protein HBI56_230760 [Parastagonospora nodorum]|uniref:Uncharacterized protein n=1 Tax=Phaeosphaeria nodorum (strain SN15 / ATCC MYA-4574 / FGSC 10173) TaxID=321614 RepID=A0A7U2FHJ0_PHANO|nr:hypothetical protein HBH56_223700 [Parastagonospora nodorum]QRD04344.1 hypothetical protein JI435_421010 [Parastagonospora nodorum SN15]KAH3921931.1 hypothetical protein HBH54_231850 [Parastagonospora nodorum]KAH3939465.1 hypothetical protein HBH53_234950 [Parastagonospora nodorum]KAH3957234.1 hypothetical protein HBH51_228320 [Parastagonospora nodorum]
MPTKEPIPSELEDPRRFLSVEKQTTFSSTNRRSNNVRTCSIVAVLARVKRPLTLALSITLLFDTLCRTF